MKAALTSPRSIPVTRRVLRPCFALLALAALPSFAAAETQQIPLAAGVNAVQFQVLPDAPSPAAVFGALGGAFVEASTYDTASKTWRYYRHSSLPPVVTADGTPGLVMGPVAPGRGYFVTTSAAITMTVVGTAPASPVVALFPGWNLVGFPVPSSRTTPIGLGDLLGGPSFRFDQASLREGASALAYDRANGVDTITAYNRNKALWVFSPQAQNWTFSVAEPPLVYFDQWSPIAVEAPLAAFGGTPLVRSIPVKLTRPYAGNVGFIYSGTASPTSDFSLPAITSNNRLGTISVNSAASNNSLDVTVLPKTRLQANSNLLLTLARPVEATPVIDSATLPQVARIVVTDGMNGVYEGFLRGGANSNFSGQALRVALRSNGQAIFDPADGGLLPVLFSLPYVIGTDGLPQFSGSVSFSLASESGLGRSVSVVIAPSTTVAAAGAGTGVPAYEVTLTLTFTNLTAAGPYVLPAKLTLTQVNAAL